METPALSVTLARSLAAPGPTPSPSAPWSPVDTSDLGGGNDTLTLADGQQRLRDQYGNRLWRRRGRHNRPDRLNASMVIGGAGMNFITGNTGTDTYVFDQHSAGNTSTITNFNGDLIALDTTGNTTLHTNAYDLGGVALADGTNLFDVADNAALLATATSNGKGGFAYQDDTGALYYSATGSFAGGGTLIGTIDSAASTPWTYDDSKFMEV